MRFKSLKSRILVSIIGVVVASLAITTFFFERRARRELSYAFEGNALNLLESTRNHVESQYNGILYHKSALLSHRKIELKNNTAIAFSIIADAYRDYENGRVSEEFAKQHAISHIRQLRFDGGVGYFWINDAARPYPRMILHPFAPELEGKILDDPKFNCALGKKENLFKAFVDVCLENEEGYIDYPWPKPSPGGLTEKQPKISYARIFKPWNWIIGSGVYIDDIEKGVRARIDAVIDDLNKTIGEQRIGESGYYFIFNEINRILAHPGLAGSDGNHLINPETGGRLLEELKRAAAGPDRVMEYTWDKPGREGEYRFPKKAYITYFEPLGWYIGATVYKEDFERKISNLTNTILPFFASFLVTALMISLLVSKNVTKPLNRLIQSISKTDDDGIPILSIPETGATEINVLGGAMNHMIDSIIQSRKELKNQRDFSRHIIDGAPYIICGLHLDGVATFINPAGERATGYRREEIIGRNLWELLYPGEEYKQVEGVLKKFAEGEVVDHEMTLTCKNGERKNIVWSNFTKRDKHGAILEIIGFGNDVTERKRAEETLRVSEERLELAMSAANDGLWDWDLITDKVYFDPRYYTMIGYEVNEFPSSLEAFQSRVHPGDVDLVMEAVSDYLGGKSDSYDVEFRFARKDGGWTWIQARAKIVARDPSGAPARFVGTHTDITERKQMELAVRESETQLRTLIETIPDLIWLKDPDGVYLSCNPEFERFFGAKEAEIAGKTDHDFVSKELADFFREKDKAAMAAGRPTTNEEEIIYAEDGRAALLETTKTPMVGPDGRLIGVLGIARDITGRKRAEKEIRRYQESLEDLVRERTGELEKEKERAEVANQAKSEFLANMSHELRTPLNHILGFTELVADQKVGELNEIQEDYLGDALSSGRHLLSLINDILDLSKVEAGKLELEMVRVDPRELLENSLVMVKEKAIRRGIRLSTELDALPDAIVGDRRALKQILYNLLSNAVKFTPDGGRVRLASRSVEADELSAMNSRQFEARPLEMDAGRHLEISVIDDGVGVKPEDLDRVFRPFEQGETSKSRRFQGTGLGLSLTRRLVELHGGRIWAESEGKGRGSVFKVVLPLE